MDDRVPTKDVDPLYFVIRGDRVLHRDRALSSATAYLYGWPADAAVLYEARVVKPWRPQIE